MNTMSPLARSERFDAVRTISPDAIRLLVETRKQLVAMREAYADTSDANPTMSPVAIAARGMELSCCDQLHEIDRAIAEFERAVG